jgi:spore coat polysaccharide biosynthesis predicted glycosyltransferase SpsG
VYEVLRLKKIPLIYTLADNQKKIEAALKQRQVFSLGDYKEIAFEKELLAEKIEAARRNENNISDLYDIFDGKGVFRIVEEICG